MRKILVADDDRAARDGFCGALSREGYAAIGAASGEEALHLVASETVCGAVLAGRLGDGITGFEICSALKRGRSPRAAVLVVSEARGGAIDEALARHHGAAGFLRKPVQPDELCAAIGAALAAPSDGATYRPLDPATARLLVVDQRTGRRSSRVARLRRQGYLTAAASGPDEARKIIARWPPDCVLLGHSLAASCRALREGPDMAGLPIVALDAPAFEGAACLALGADHFVEDRADPAVLLATVEALLRRHRLDLGIVAFRDLSLHPHDSSVRVYGRTKVKVSAAPFQLMRLLVERAAVPVSREELCERLGCAGVALDRRASRLREELGELAGRVQTSRGLGLAYVPPHLE